MQQPPVYEPAPLPAVLRLSCGMTTAEGYGQCTHPAIQKGPDGHWYCTECGQLRS